MKIDNHEQQYNITLDAGEVISISINQTGVYSETVDEGMEGKVTFMFQEYLTGTQG